MTEIPSLEEWDTSLLQSERRSYLDIDQTFEDVVARTKVVVVGYRVEPLRDYPRGQPKIPRKQAILRMDIGREPSDLLWNARDGLRARYWQSPDQGDKATKHFIETFAPTLLAFARANLPLLREKVLPLSIEQVEATLLALSAKIWPLERNDTGSLLVGQELRIPRWEQNQLFAEYNQGEWRKTPKGNEFVPPGKRDRAMQIHRFGFT
jgi:hypothetical protein